MPIGFSGEKLAFIVYVFVCLLLNLRLFDVANRLAAGGMSIMYKNYENTQAV